MWQADRTSMQQVFIDSWRKHRQQQTMSPLEQHIAKLIDAHPMYQAAIESPINQTDDDHWFGHLSAHLALEEQLNTNRPHGIQGIYQKLCQQHTPHEAQHHMMARLIEHIPLIQQQRVDAEQQYLDSLHRLTTQQQD